MRTTIIPAQVTTVEDTIAGNLNLTQILLLVSSLFISTSIYALFPVRLEFSPYKIVLIYIVFLLCITLSLRIKNRVVLNWLVILGTFVIRPHVYLFDKNNESVRDFVQEKEIAPKKPVKTLRSVERKIENPLQFFDYHSLIRNPALNIRFKRHSIQVVKNYD